MPKIARSGRASAHLEQLTPTPHRCKLPISVPKAPRDRAIVTATGGCAAPDQHNVGMSCSRFTAVATSVINPGIPAGMTHDGHSGTNASCQSHLCRTACVAFHQSPLAVRHTNHVPSACKQSGLPSSLSSCEAGCYRPTGAPRLLLISRLNCRRVGLTSVNGRIRNCGWTLGHTGAPTRFGQRECVIPACSRAHVYLDPEPNCSIIHPYLDRARRTEWRWENWARAKPNRLCGRVITPPQSSAAPANPPPSFGALSFVGIAPASPKLKGTSPDN